MTVTVSKDRIVLTGAATVEDAEPLLRALLEKPDLAVDISGLVSAHFAVIQLLKAADRPCLGRPANPFLRDFVFSDCDISAPK